jgi:putative transposase
MQCELAGVPRSSAYRRMEAACRRQLEDAEDLKLRALIDEEYTRRPFYGSRRMVAFLRVRKFSESQNLERSCLARSGEFCRSRVT